MKADSFRNKVIVVTGGGSGLGAALVRKFARFGARVTIIDVNADAVEKVVNELVLERVLHVPDSKILDVGDDIAFCNALNELKEIQGVFDIMVNNAGILMAGEARDLDSKMFRTITSINHWGVVNGSLAAFKIMAGQGHGKIVNISSVSGLSASPLYSAYSMTKHAVIGFSKALREEGRSLGIDVILICPGTLKPEYLRLEML